MMGEWRIFYDCQSFKGLAVIHTIFTFFRAFRVFRGQELLYRTHDVMIIEAQNVFWTPYHFFKTNPTRPAYRINQSLYRPTTPPRVPHH
jgi:hypothetical protein